MSEPVQITLSILVLIVVYLMTQLLIAFRIGRAARAIVRELDRLEAYDPFTAVDLPYARAKLLRLGLRDFRPSAVQALVQVKVVSRTHAGKYFLARRAADLKWR